MANFYASVRLAATLCPAAGNATREAVVWANFLAGFEDIDMGTRADGAKAPFYVADHADATIELNLWARPRQGQYLRSFQGECWLPGNISTSGGAWEGTGVWAGDACSATFNSAWSSTAGVQSYEMHVAFSCMNQGAARCRRRRGDGAAARDAATSRR